MDLSEWRNQIDSLDRQIVELLNQRCECAREIGRLKRARHQPVLSPERETAVLDHVASLPCEGLGPDALRRIFQQIITEMRQMQEAEQLPVASVQRQR